MKRFVIAATLAVAFGLGFAHTANAQYVLPYAGFTPNGGFDRGTTVITPGGVQSYNTYVSPFGTVKQSATATNAFGTSIGVSRGFNPYTGIGFNRGFYTPSPYLYPYGTGYGYNFYRRW
jgi:hypothetical protein